MPRDLTCPSCQCQFPVAKKPGKKEVRCPLCSTVCEQPAVDEAATPARRGRKCPGCKKIMERGVTYCATCNVSLFDAWGDAEASAPAAGRRAEMQGYASLAGKTVRIFIYFITFRWWKILDEL